MKEAEASLFMPNDENTILVRVADDAYLEEVIKDWKPARPTKVFATYWYFAAARQQVFFRRLRGKEPPWTDDTILATHRFTNAYRASDRVSQFLIQKVLYPDGMDVFGEEDIVFRTLLFKFFNKIETWKLLEESVQEIRWDNYDFERYDSTLTRAMEQKSTIFSAAYIMPSGGSTFGSERKHRNYLHLLAHMMEERLPRQIARARGLRQVFETLREYPLLGDFLAFQYAIDLNYSPLLSFAEDSFVVAGPGARDGIRKCFSHLGGLSEEEIIARMAERQTAEFTRLGIDFPSLWGRPLQLIDCQNLFCEVDKYARVAHPDIAGISGRTRIKQVYKTNSRGYRPQGMRIAWYPPRWGINERIVKSFPDDTP